MRVGLKKFGAGFFAALFIAQVLFWAPGAESAAGVPKIISYQGRLANSSGSLLGGSGTTYYFRFGVWNASSGGTRLWPSGGGDPCAHALTVREGVFNAGIGDSSECSDALDYNFNDNDTVYLQVEVSSNGTSWETLTPRQRIGASGFAINAQTISGSTGGTPNVLGNLVTAYGIQGGASATSGTVFLLDTPSSFVGNFINIQQASTTRFILDQGGRAAFGTSTFSGLSILTVGATSTESIPLTLKAVSGQTANLFQIQNAASANLLMVDSEGRVGIGTTTATRRLNVLNADSAAQVRISQTGSVYGEWYVDSAGDVQLSSTGGNIRGNNENLFVCASGGCGVNTPVTKGNAIIENSLIFGNKFYLQQIDASTTNVYDTTDTVVLQFDEATTSP